MCSKMNSPRGRSSGPTRPWTRQPGRSGSGHLPQAINEHLIGRPRKHQRQGQRRPHSRRPDAGKGPPGSGRGFAPARWRLSMSGAVRSHGTDVRAVTSAVRLRSSETCAPRDSRLFRPLDPDRRRLSALARIGTLQGSSTERKRLLRFNAINLEFPFNANLGVWNSSRTPIQLYKYFLIFREFSPEQTTKGSYVH